MHLHQLRYFVAVADCGSFTRGAEAAFITQPALSGAISKLEEGLGAPLFERRARGVRLTAAGERFLPRARTILRELEAARSDARQQDGAPARLRVGLLHTLPMGRIAPLVRQLMALDAGMRWRFVEGSAADIEAQVAAGQLDLAFTRLSHAKAGMHQLRLFDDALQLAVPAESALGRSGPLRPQALEGQPLVVRTRCEHLPAARQWLEREGVRPMVMARMRADDRALAWVAAGLGACFAPDSHAREGVRFVAVEGIALRRTVTLEWPAAVRDARVAALLARVDARLSASAAA